MENYPSEATSIIDPLDFLAQCSLDEFLNIEALDHDYISEQINKIDSEDLKESLEKSYIKDKYVHLEDLLECLENFQNTNKSQHAMCSDLKSTSDDNFTLNAQNTNLKETTKDFESFLLEKDNIDKQMNFIQSNLEKSMLETHMSCQCLCKTNKMDSTFDAHHKTKNLFDNSINSRKSLKIFDEARAVTCIDFFSGKRKTLTNELEMSRHHLKNYGYDMLKTNKKIKKNISCTFMPAMA